MVSGLLKWKGRVNGGSKGDVRVLGKDQRKLKFGSVSANDLFG